MQVIIYIIMFMSNKKTDYFYLSNKSTYFKYLVSFGKIQQLSLNKLDKFKFHLLEKT